MLGQGDNIWATAIALGNASDALTPSNDSFWPTPPDSADSKRSVSRYWRLLPAFRYVHLSADYFSQPGNGAYKTYRT